VIDCDGLADFGGFGGSFGLVVGFSLKGLLLGEVAGGQLNRSHIWEAGAAF